MQNNNILPCPCCNNEIKGGVRLSGFSSLQIKYIKCIHCGLRMEIRYEVDEISSQEQLKAITKELVTRWNTRKPMGHIVEQLETELKRADKEKQRCVSENPMQFDSAKGYATGISNALEIIKGGVDNG
jgi:hypothetical protein